MKLVTPAENQFLKKKTFGSLTTDKYLICNKMIHLCPFTKKKILTILVLRFNVYGSEVLHTVKPVLSGHSKIDKTKILMTHGS